MPEQNPATTSDVPDQIVEIRASIKRIEDVLLNVGKPLRQGTSAVALARTLHSARRLRGHFLPAQLFADPAWDILLDLYLARAEGRSVHTSSACHGARVPQTTGLRWLDRMEKAGVIARRSSADDLRMVNVELTRSTYAAMTRLLDRVCQDLPALD